MASHRALELIRNSPDKALLRRLMKSRKPSYSGIRSRPYKLWRKDPETATYNLPKQFEEREKYLSSKIVALKKQGFDPHLFRRSTVDQILDAIISNESIEGVDITARMQQHNFRFMNTTNPDHSLKVSHALATFLKNSRAMDIQKTSAEGVKKRNENADDFAKNMFNVIEKVKKEEKISSYRDTVEALNKKKIPTYNDTGKGEVTKEWHISTLQKLVVRWKNLGLVPPNPTPK